MIAAGNPQDFVPYGREHCKLHPGNTHLQTPSANRIRPDLGLQLLTALKDVSLKDKPDIAKEQWLLRSDPTAGNENCDEELYASGHTVVWSKGNSLQNRYMCKAFTVDNLVQQVLWCDFLLANNKALISIDDQDTQVNCEIQPSICVVDTANLNVFTIKGEEFITPFPFQVTQVWPMVYGLLLERMVSSTEINTSKRDLQLPTLFSLLHPLDEITPVLKVTSPHSSSLAASSKIGLLSDQHMQVVFTSISPSLVMFYDSALYVHTVWKLRKAKIEEIQMLSQAQDTLMHTFTGTPQPQVTSHSSAGQSRLLHSNYSSSQPSGSPFRNYSSHINSPLQQSRSFSPNVSNLTHMATLSRSQSPAATNSNIYRYACTPSPGRSPSTYSKQLTTSISSSFVGDKPSQLMEPLAPDVTLELLWTESSNIARSSEDGKASKAFLTSDFVGQRYLCYLLPAYSQLRCIKYEESNDKSQLIFGVVTNIAAKDAVTLQNCDMMLLLDTSYSLVLYSGTNKMCNVYVPCMPASFIADHRISLHGIDRRSSLITSSRPASAMDARFDEEVHLLSPVAVENCDMSTMEGSFVDELNVSSTFTAVKLSDAVNNRVTVEYSWGQVFRITIPQVYESSLVQTCLQALKNLLPRDVAIQLYTKWYSSVNALGYGKNSRLHEWSIFVGSLLGMMGYDIEKLAIGELYDFDLSLSPVTAKKKFKSSNAGSDEDWQYLAQSNASFQNVSHVKNRLGLNFVPIQKNMGVTTGKINVNASLFPYIPTTLYALHVVYEELKLNVLLWDDLQLMAPLLIHLARDLKVNAFLDFYWRDHPQFVEDNASSQIDESLLKSMQYPTFLTAEPPSIFHWLYDCIRNQCIDAFPYIPNVTNNIQRIVLLYALMSHKDSSVPLDSYLRKIVSPGFRNVDSDDIVSINNYLETSNTNNMYELVVKCLTLLDYEMKNLESLPIGVALPLRNAIFHCRRNPPSSWPESAYCLIGRQDLSAQLKDTHKQPSSPIRNKNNSSNENKKTILPKDDDDGMEQLDYEVLKLRFSNDQRIKEVRRLLQSSKPVRIAVVQRPEVSDHDFIEEQERHLYALCMRTMALPVGRGMFTLRMSQPVVTETLPIPKLCLTGRAPPRNTTVDLSHVEPPSNMNVWPLFHNGVAAGLKIMPNASQIDSTWIVYNKPKNSSEMPMEHAGFLMALGLNGHLNNLATMNIHDYLCKGHELTSVGLLLGIAAAKRGTMDVATTKLLSIHIEAMLPPTSTELDVPHVVQVAAVLGMGLVYEGTSHRHVSEILLSEIGRPPGPEMENSNDRESYSLAAGLALGLVTLGAGNNMSGLLEPGMADQLYHFMVGGHKRPLMGIHKEKYKSPSYQIKEGDSVNIDVTSPGATLALGMMYFQTGNRAVAEWMSVPDTQFLLDFVRSDFLLIRTFSKGLILWDDIYPSSKWVQSHIPQLIARHAFKKNREKENVDCETMNQAYVNIIAGACMALGFRFAGSANDSACSTLTEYVKLFINNYGKQTAEQTGRNTIETCLNVILLALAMVMAGTGDLEVLRICRYLHFRIGQANNHVLYGSHMATHMAIGLLFLGGGKFTLGTKPSSIAAMICSFFPKFPIHSSDNRYHLQAFRHLYVLAVEPRLVVPRDIDNSKACYTNLRIRFKDTPWYKNVEYCARAPCLLPELDLLEEILVEDSRYWPIRFHREKNWNSLRCLLENHGTLYVKQRAGCLSYVDDPQGFSSTLSQRLMKDITSDWTVKPEVIEAVSCDSSILNFAKYFLQLECPNKQESELKQLLCEVFYECVTQEKTEILATCITIVQAIHHLTKTSNLNRLWQVKLILQFCRNSLNERSPTQEYLLNPEFAIAMESLLEKRLKRWYKENHQSVIAYLCKGPLLEQHNNFLSHFLTYFNIPASHACTMHPNWSTNLAALCLQLGEMKLSSSALMVLLSKH